MHNLYIPLCGLVLSIILLIVYISKSSKIKKENEFYFGMILNAIGMTIFCILAVWLLYQQIPDQGIIKFFNKLQCIVIINFFTNLLMYVLYACDIKIKNIMRYYWTGLIIISVIILAAPVHLEVTSDLNYMVTLGMAVDITAAISALLLLCTFVVALRHRSILKEKLIPVILLIFFIVGVMLVRNFIPEFIVLEFAATVGVLIMYFTIENPDMNMLVQTRLAKLQADKASEAKNEFLSSMSHEMKTPINVIANFSEFLVASTDEEERNNYAKEIQLASMNLSDIMNNMFLISSFDTGKTELKETEYNPVKEINETLKALNSRLKEKEFKLDVYIAPDIPTTLYGDKQNLKVVVYHLLSNAIKFTEIGKVSLSIQSLKKGDQCNLIIDVSDTGKGINKEDLDKIFDKWQRSADDINTTRSGAGLGLAIVKYLTELMGGEVYASSTVEIGSRFTIKLTQKIIDEAQNTTEIFDYYKYSEEVKEISNTENEKIDCSNKRVLIVDDTKTNITVAKIILKSYNINVDAANSGQECLNKVNNGEKYDFILMDIMMPEMDGTKTFKKLKEIDGFNTPVVAFTADTADGAKGRYLSLGFNHYIAKGDSMREEIENYIENEFSSN